jgi:predicted DCC family thiol-disulfide oxidoreductase YuxK
MGGTDDRWILTAMRRVSDWWLAFWFEPSSPTNLGVSRALFFAGVLAVHVGENYSAWGNVSDAFWLPMPLFTALHLKAFSPPALNVLQTAWRLALTLSAVGLLSRVSMTVAFLLSTYLFGLPHNFGQTYHFDALLVIVTGILACSRAGDAWSVDALMKGRNAPEPNGEYTWPIRMAWVAMALVFFAAGLAKLRYGGLEWVTSDNMTILLRRAAYHVSDADPISTAGLWIADRPWLSRALAGISLAVELGFVFALFSRTARALMVPAAFLMLIGIRVLMGPTFGGFLVANVFWVNWDALGERLFVWLRPTRRVTVLFDGDCGLCTNVIEAVRRLDLLDAVTALDVTSEWSSIAVRFPALTHAACLADMHVIAANDSVTVGFDGYRELAKVLPLGWFVLPVLYLPGVPAIGRRIYRLVADRRGRSQCVVPPIRPSA